MAKLKKIKRSGFTTMANSAIEDNRLSLRDRGLLQFIYHLPEDWNFSIMGLQKVLGGDDALDKRDALRKSLNNLERMGYLRRIQKREGGRFGENDWLISDQPIRDEDLMDGYYGGTTEKATVGVDSVDGFPADGDSYGNDGLSADFPSSVFPSTEFPSTEKSSSVQPPQINKNIISKKKQNKEEQNTKRTRKNLSLDLPDGRMEEGEKKERETPLQEVDGARERTVTEDMLEAIIETYKRKVGPVNQMTAGKLYMLVEGYGADKVLDAIDVAYGNGAGSIEYVKKILLTWKNRKDRKARTVEDIRQQIYNPALQSLKTSGLEEGDTEGFLESCK